MIERSFPRFVFGNVGLSEEVICPAVARIITPSLPVAQALYDYES
jgi:hypothetical protein